MSVEIQTRYIHSAIRNDYVKLEITAAIKRMICQHLNWVLRCVVLMRFTTSGMPLKMLDELLCWNLSPMNCSALCLYAFYALHCSNEL